MVATSFPVSHLPAPEERVKERGGGKMRVIGNVNEVGMLVGRIELTSLALISKISAYFPERYAARPLSSYFKMARKA